MTSEATRKIIGNWVFKYILNIKQPPDDGLEVFAKALFIAAKGDGKISQAERDWVIGITAAKGAPETLIEELKTYEGDDDVNELIARNPFSSQARENLIYNAIQASGADVEYHDNEKVYIRKIATSLKLSEEKVQEIESIYQEEQALFKKKIKVLYPNGHPLLYDDNGN